MKISKRIASLIMAMCITLCAFSGAVSASAVSTVKKTMMQYTEQELGFAKSDSVEYKCEVTNNSDNFVKVDAEDWGEYFKLQVRAKKVTANSKKPVITVYNEDASGKKTTIKKYQIAVKAYKKVDMKDIKLNKGVEKTMTLNNPYYKYYDFEYNKKIINIRQNLYDGNKEYHTIIGLKKGKTTVKAYLRNTKKLAGSFTVTIGDYKAGIKKSYKEKTIYFNKHINTLDLNGGFLDLSKAISNYHENSTYTVKISNTKLAGSKSYKYNGYYAKINSKFPQVYSKKTGKVKLIVYEQRGKCKKKKIGTIKLTIKQAKDSKVYESYRELDNDGIFYENFLSPGESYNLKAVVVGRYMNPAWTKEKYYFKENEYTFTATATRPDIVSVDENGICTCHSLYYSDDKGEAPYINYEIVFSDGSKVSGGGFFDLVDEDFWG